MVKGSMTMEERKSQGKLLNTGPYMTTKSRMKLIQKAACCRNRFCTGFFITVVDKQIYILQQKNKSESVIYRFSGVFDPSGGIFRILMA
jgi:hypothetical protein